MERALTCNRSRGEKIMKRTNYPLILAVAALTAAMTAGAASSEEFAVDLGVDFYSRYIWRGMDFGDAPSVQPALSFSYSGFELGVWGAYPLSNQENAFDEIDFWLGYSYGFDNESSIGAVATSYYFPNAGIGLFNFNDYDAVDGNGDLDPGAHTVELGLTYTGPKQFPLTISGYVVVHNDAGHNTYFQVDYPFAVGETALTVFCGAAGGSRENPGFYGVEDFSVINVGVSAERGLRMTESFALPLSVAFIVNPDAEISYLVVGVKF
jgi:uncharacterized protein (TIGR02001 family)